MTAIHYACRSASISSIVTLIEMGADPRNPETNENQIPLDLIPSNQQAKLGALIRNTCKRCYSFYQFILNKRKNHCTVFGIEYNLGIFLKSAHRRVCQCLDHPEPSNKITIHDPSLRPLYG